MKTTDLEFYFPTIKSLTENFSEHINADEEDDLVRLENALKTKESEKLVSSFRRTKTFAPTRSHPTAPDKPPFEAAIGLLTTPSVLLVVSCASSLTRRSARRGFECLHLIVGFQRVVVVLLLYVS
ncbi:hypothetical protein AJ78_06749 [Emergomyces pasteurianus Ep9510]|uniref:Uncharacterized protein n=1 Tax=Emergomyces pasteurianus Ep9510 TaxID=1447872 RepID=A0A1J9P9T3_9EURO|nr:hypothetical protein AJ78_06749 [Emergomyces pasteurianus Ep9510]